MVPLVLIFQKLVTKWGLWDVSCAWDIPTSRDQVICRMEQLYLQIVDAGIFSLKWSFFKLSVSSKLVKIW